MFEERDIVVSIDVATHKTGSALYFNKKLINYELWELTNEPFSGEKVKKDIKLLDEKVIKFLSFIVKERFMTIQEKANITIILEMSNYGIKSVGQKLSFYVGMFVFSIYNTLMLLLPYSTIKIKLINSREWQLRRFGQVLDREQGKLKSIEKAKNIIGEHINELDDNIADAINIGFLANVLRDNYLIGQETKTRFKQTQNNKIKIATLKAKAIDLYKKLLLKQEKALFKKINTKKYKNNPNEKIIKKSLYDIANIQEKKRIDLYKTQMIELQTEIKEINDFFIMGVEGQNEK